MVYKPPFFLFNKHLETIYPSLLRKVNFTFQQTERITTPDNDWLEVSSSSLKSDKVVIISHGLEGSSDRPYIRGMAKAFFEKGFDVVAWNYRGCASEMNKQLRFYHSGATDDLDVVINHAIQLKYTSINLIGFSLGGNITLKYLGEDRNRSEILKKAVAISVPMELKTGCERLSTPANKIYHDRFLKSLKNKIIAKSKLMEGLDIKGIESITTLKDFDDRYTAPLHGFRDAYDYYSQCSSVRYVHNIQIPALILTALNDPFLSEECYPFDQVKNHETVVLETPERGGHVGFAQLNNTGLYWSEQRALDFIR